MIQCQGCQCTSTCLVSRLQHPPLGFTAQAISSVFRVGSNGLSRERSRQEEQPLTEKEEVAKEKRHVGLCVVERQRTESQTRHGKDEEIQRRFAPLPQEKGLVLSVGETEWKSKALVGPKLPTRAHRLPGGGRLRCKRGWPPKL
ncbi:unnamed protein product [Gadus morhua 'NCC']